LDDPKLHRKYGLIQLHLTNTFPARMRVRLDMQAANNHREFKNNDPIWHFIAEYPLNEVARDENHESGLTAGSLYQAIRNLGVPADGLNKIEGTIIGTFRKAMSRFNYGSPNLPVYIRLFCQRKAIDGGRHSVDQIKGGWGYFLIDKGWDIPTASHEEFYCMAELYLYREGEMPQSSAKRSRNF
jgi:hypothetical protein